MVPKYFGAVHPEKRPSIYLTDVCPSNVWGLYTPKIFDGCGCTPPKYLMDVRPSNIWGLYTPKIFDGQFRQIFGGCRPPKYLTDVRPSNIWGLTPKIFDPFRQIYTPKYLTDVRPCCRPPKYFRPSNIWGLYTPKIFDGCASVKYLGADPQNI